MANSGGRYEGEIPDGISPIVGIRAWRVLQTLRKEDRLSSVYKNGIHWPVGKELEAQCIQPASVWGAIHGMTVKFNPTAEGLLHESPEDHRAPFTDCTCGIYALNSDLVEGEVRPWQTNSIIGIVLLWGHVLEGDRGYRAQYAKVVALWMDSGDPERIDLITQMADMYEVPVIFDLPGELEKQKSLQGGNR